MILASHFLTWIFSSLTQSRSLATRKCLLPPWGARLCAPGWNRLLAIGLTGHVEPWHTARAVRRWSSQDQGSYAMALIQWGPAPA